MNEQSRSTMPAFLSRLAIPFAIFFAVTAEMTPAGAIHHIADGFRVDISTAAFGTAIYATATAVVAIPLSYALQGAPLRKAFMLVGGLFAIANLATALAPSFSIYLVIRCLNGIIHGAFFPLALALSANSTEPNSERATARALLGNAFALAVGVPIAENISAASTWKLPFLITAAGMLLWIFCTPRIVKSSKISKGEGSAPGSLLPILSIGALFAIALTGHFAFYTFLAPHVDARGMSASVVLAAYGIAVILGTWFSGYLAKRGRLRRAALVLIVEALALAATVYWANVLVVSIGTVVVGLCFGILPTLVQSEMLSRSEGRNTIASGVAVVAFNGGIASGTFLGGIARQFTADTPFLFAATVIAFASVLFFIGGRQSSMASKGGVQLKIKNNSR